MYPDFKELLAILNANGVRYLIVGGYQPVDKFDRRSTDRNMLRSKLVRPTT
jgi:hypothetical protein